MTIFVFDRSSGEMVAGFEGSISFIMDMIEDFYSDFGRYILRVVIQ